MEKKSLTRLIAVESVAMALALCFVFTVKAIADDVIPVPVTDVPEWLRVIMGLVMGLPYVGPIVIEILKWVGVVAALATGISTTIAAILVTLRKIGKAAGFENFAAGVQKIFDIVWPYIAWLSIYNVQKK